MPQSLNYSPTFAERYPVAFIAALVDAGLAMLAAYLAFFIRFDTYDLTSPYLLAAIAWAALVVAASFVMGAYGSWRGQSFLRQVLRVVGGWLLAAAVLTMLGFLLKTSANYSRLWFTYTMAISAGLGIGLRLLVFIALRRARRSGRNLKQVVVVGPTDGQGAALPSAFALREQGYAVAGIVSCTESADWLSTLPEKVAAAGAHEVWLMLPLNEGAQI